MTTARDEAVFLARRARSLGVSPTVAMAKLAADRRKSGLEVIDLTVGEPDQETPLHAVLAAENALRSGQTRYTDAAGLSELRSAVADRYGKDYRLRITLEEAMICCGGKHALYLACQTLLDRGDEVVITSPHWPSFEQAVRLAGARPIVVKTVERECFRIRPQLLERTIGPRSRAIIVNSPANPTSTVVADDVLMSIARLARKRRLMVFYDDAYGRLVYGASQPPLGSVREILGDRLVILGTASKTYCMTGWRIGWIIGPRSVVAACIAMASHSTQCPTAFAQIGAVKALSGPQNAVAEMAAEYRKRRDAVLPLLRNIPNVTCVEPAGGFYAFPNVSYYAGSRKGATTRLARDMLESAGVGVVPGEAFGAPGYIRISLARPRKELVAGISKIAAFLAREVRK